MTDPVVTDLGPPPGDQLRYCEYCRMWRHHTGMRVEGRACKWCWAAFLSWRDEGIRKGLFTSDEFFTVLGLTDPPRAWLPGDVYHAIPEPEPSIKELNRPFLGDAVDELDDDPERPTLVPYSPIWIPDPAKRHPRSSHRS